MRWNRGVLPVAAALAVLMIIFAAVAAGGWFARDKPGLESPALPEDLLGLLTLIVIPVQILLLIVAMVGFNQAWNVEEERPTADNRYSPPAARGRRDRDRPGRRSRRRPRAPRSGPTRPRSKRTRRLGRRAAEPRRLTGASRTASSAARAAAARPGATSLTASPTSRSCQRVLGRRPQQLEQLVGLRFGIDPGRLRVAVEHDRHPVVDRAHGIVGRARDQSAADQRRLPPALEPRPDAREGEQLAAGLTRSG